MSPHFLLWILISGIMSLVVRRFQYSGKKFIFLILHSLFDILIISNIGVTILTKIFTNIDSTIGFLMFTIGYLTAKYIVLTKKGLNHSLLTDISLIAGCLMLQDFLGHVQRYTEML